MMPVRRQVIELANPDEPEEIRMLTKGQLYDQLSNRFFLPDKNSKGVNRRYLVGVYTNEYFNVDEVFLKRFEIDLTPGQLKKAPFVSLPDLYTKVNQMLRELNRPQLGFPPGAIPEEKWLIRVTRYLDPHNVTGAFLETIPDAPAQDFESQRMIDAKRNAEAFLMGEHHLLDNPMVFKEIKHIWEAQKRITAKQKDLEHHQRVVQDLQVKLAQEQLDLQANISKAALTVLTVGRGLLDADQVFHEENGNAYRLEVNEIRSL
jgi:hypothetical protein